MTNEWLDLDSQRIYYYYNELLSMYEAGISFENIQNMIGLDGAAFKQNEQCTYSKSSDWRCIEYALQLIKTKIENYEKKNEMVKTFFDYVNTQIADFQEILNGGIDIESLENMVEYDIACYENNKNQELNTQVVTTSDDDKEQKRFAINVLKRHQ